MNQIKKLFSLKEIPKEKNEEMQIDNAEKEEIQTRVTYYQSGYVASVKSMGNSINFEASLENVYHSYLNQCRKQTQEQQRLKQPEIIKKSEQERELKNKETLVSINVDKIKDLDKKEEKTQNDIAEVKNNPEKFGITVTKKPHALFYIGLALLIPITIYLFVFYISTSYSAFFKEFSDDSLQEAIFDGQALNKAISDGWLEGVLVITIPSVFLALGYIIHMVQREKGIKNSLKLFALYAITFLFDGLLAYQIENKIYNFNKTPDTPQFNLTIAIQQAEFWMIIFAGFVVYIIWGLVFDLIMKEHESIDKINGFINTKKNELKQFHIQKEKLEVEISDTKNLISNINGEIQKLQITIDSFIINKRQYLHYHSQYKEGWLQAISTELALPDNKKTELLEKCVIVSSVHIINVEKTETIVKDVNNT